MASRRSVAGILAGATLAALAPALASAVPTGPPSPLTNPAAIQALAADAYTWAVAPEYVYRFLKYNALHTAPVNVLGGKGELPAAWNNLATNAGDASVLYLNSMIDLSGKPVPGSPNGRTTDMVLTVPPSKNNYYVVNLLDSFINSTGSIGTRTTPSVKPQTYLIAGPKSKYAKNRFVTINGFRYRVLPTDTNYNWMLIRIRADSLVPPSDPQSTASVYKRTIKRFAFNTLAQFQANGNKPIYPTTYSYPPNKVQAQLAQMWKNAPTQATAFFEQAGRSLVVSPLPSKNFGLGNTPLKALPAWVVPQANAKVKFQNPSYGQTRELNRFTPLGLTAKGFRVPSNWGQDQLNALQAGYIQGTGIVANMSSSVGASPTTNYWSFLNNDIGTYPNNGLGYLYRASVVQGGGSANVPLDAVYPQVTTLDGTAATQVTGDSTYSVTFGPEWVQGSALPANGTTPPMVNDSSGNPRGFWSLHTYQLDPSQSAAPYLTQASALNLAYSSANQQVRSVDATADTITVGMPTWGGAPEQSTPIFFGSGAEAYGLKANTTYYVASVPKMKGKGRKASYTFQVSTTWKQIISPTPPAGQQGGGVPEQGPDGTPGPLVDFQAGTGALMWGPVQPVSQLGSQQITSGKLAKNADGSVTLWAGPTLPAGVPATNWLPMPSTAYLQQVYGQALPTPQMRMTLRMYYPTPGSNTAPSVLPPPNGSMTSTWVPPVVKKVS